MAQLRDDIQKFEFHQTVILVVGPESPSAFSRYWVENSLPFIGLPDPSHEILKLYGQEVNLFKLGRMPASVLIDKNGIVRAAHYGKNMSDIPENEELIRFIQDL